MQQQQSIKDSKFYLVTFHDGKEWQEDELVEKSPVPRVRQLLGGRWETSKQYDEFNMKVFYNGQRRVLVIGFPPDKTKEEAIEAINRIRESREDRN